GARARDVWPTPTRSMARMRRSPINGTSRRQDRLDTSVPDNNTTGGSGECAFPLHCTNTRRGPRRINWVRPKGVRTGAVVCVSVVRLFNRLGDLTSVDGKTRTSANHSTNGGIRSFVWHV